MANVGVLTKCREYISYVSKRDINDADFDLLDKIDDAIHKDDSDLNERLAEIIKYQGWRFPILVSKQTGFIIAGHARQRAAQILKYNKVPIDVQDFDDYDQEISQLVADNALQEWRPVNLAAVNEIVVPKLDGSKFKIEMLGIKKFKVDRAEKKQKTCPSCGHLF